MEATATKTTKQRQQIGLARVRALVRFNTLTFHSVTIASFLEAAAQSQAERLIAAFAGHHDVRLWLEHVWWPQRAGHGRRLREYVEMTWPEFDWNAAYEEFFQVNRARAGLEGRGAGVAVEALSLCAMAAQAAVFYRALANCADEPALRALAREAACDHVTFFEYFRALFERWKRRDRIGLAAAWRALQATCRAARDLKVEAAFAPLAHHWKGASTVPELTYSEFRPRMALLIRRHAALGSIERMLFRAWLERGSAAPAPQLPSAQPPRLLAQLPRPSVA